MDWWLTRTRCAFALTLGMLAALDGCNTGKDETEIDADFDGHPVGFDCDDNDGRVYPGAPEYCNEGIDRDCDGVPPPPCMTDFDGDGFLVEDDCDDEDAAVNPDAVEDCWDDVDNDCNGVATQCLERTLQYAGTSVAPLNSYGTAVFADRFVFGDPGGGGTDPIGDGRVVIFDAGRFGEVSELDADLTGAGAAGALGGYGLDVVVFDGLLCLGAGDHDFDAVAPNAGKTWCFDSDTIGDTGDLDLDDALFTISGEDADGHTRILGGADVDGDGFEDLLVASSQGVHVVRGDGSDLTGDFLVPTQAYVTLGECDASGSELCGYAAAVNSNAVAISGSGGPSDTISIYSFPLLGGGVTPSASYPVDRAETDGVAAVSWTGGFAVGSSTQHRVEFFAIDGTPGVVLDNPADELFGTWVDAVRNYADEQLLLVGAPTMLNEGIPSGGVYVFNLSLHGLPSDTEEAVFKLVAPDEYANCGFRSRGGIGRLDIGFAELRVHTFVTSTCPGSGALAYSLDSVFEDPPPPLPMVGDIEQVGPNGYALRRSFVDGYTSYLPWVQSLAQTEPVVQDEAIVGWRLDGIEPGSPLGLAGLRNGDLVRRVNGTPLTSVEIVNELAMSLLGASEVNLRIRRGGVPRTLHYSVVQ